MKKFFAWTLAVLMLVTVLPLSALAAVDYNETDSGCDFYHVIQKTDYALAPGAVESEIIVNSEDGANRNVLHVIEVDLKNPNISIMPTYKGLKEGIDFEDSSNWGQQVLTEQAAHVENDLGLNVVGGMNTCLRYDNDHPYGVLVWNGVVYSDERNESGVSTAQTFLSVTKDGVASLHSASEPIPEDCYNAISANFGWIIKDGVSQYKTDDHADSARAPRSVIGIKADGTLVLLMNDGRQSPYSAGATMRELAEWLLSMGCVDAVNCDGGGSSTFISEREGTGELTMKSSPSDGYIRPTLGGILVISNAVADGKFDHATVKSTEQYVTPGSTVEFTSVGADSAGGPAEIPEDISWQLSDSSMGTVEDGVFVSSGKVGTATVQMVYNGEVVGEDSVEVVIPEAISFEKATYVVPYGKSLKIVAKATINDGLNIVTVKDGDISLELSDDTVGTLNGNVFSAVATEVDVTTATVTATFVGTDISGTTTVKLGRGSEVVLDFENYDLGSSPYTYVNAHNYGHGDSSVVVVDKDTGKVRNGEQALAINVDGTEYRYYGTFSQNRITDNNSLHVDGIKEATAIGMWLYIPDEAIGLQLGIRFNLTGNKNTKSTLYFFDQEYTATIERDQWRYFTVDVSDVAYESFDLYSFELFMYETDGGKYDSVDLSQESNLLGKYTLYIDDVTIDYSEAVEDREIPVIDSVKISNDDMGIVMNGQTITENVIGVFAQAKDFVADNAVGLDISTAKVFVDGVQVTENFSCDANGKMSLSGVKLSDGAHVFRFEIADANGNVASIQRYVVVDAEEKAPSVSVVPHDPEANNLLIGSNYWVDVKADAIETIKEVSVTVKLDGTHDWKADFIEVAEGFTVTYTLDNATNDLTLDIKKTGAVSATGEGVLVSVPLQVWSYEQYYNKTTAIDPSVTAIDWAVQNSWNRAVKLSSDNGIVTFVDGTSESFAMAPISVDTECNPESKTAEINRWHIHKVEAVADLDPTCTKNGYTGRTVCVGCVCNNTSNEHDCATVSCNSVVDWGTVIPATGHSYVIVDGTLVCETCEAANIGYNGYWETDDGWYYFFENQAATGWINLDDGWHYFLSNGLAAVGTVTIGGLDYRFDGEQGKSIGAWKETENGKMFYFCHRYYKSSWGEIDGVKYYFNNAGIMLTGLCTVGANVWEFAEDGAFIKNVDGVFYEPTYNYYGYAIDGAMQYDTGLVKWNENFYYVRPNGRLVTWPIYVSEDKANGYVVAGNYSFGADGKLQMLNGPVADPYNSAYLNFYKDGIRVYEEGLYEYNGDYYYVRSNGLLLTWGSYISKTNGYLPAGEYKFGADGKLIMLNGPVADAFNSAYLNFYKDGVRVYEEGLYEYNGDYYYVRANGLLATWTINITEDKANGFVDAGEYEFGADGKMVK